MSAFLSSVFGAGAQLFNNNGFVLSGGKINTYLAGSTTPQATWTDSTQAVQNANPIVLDSTGRITGSGEIWLQSGVAYKFVVTDSLNNTIGTWDNISGVNDISISASEWSATGLTPTYISGTSFSVPGNQTSVFPVNQRVKYVVSAGTGYGYVRSSTFTSLTTVIIVPDSTVLDSGLSSINVGFLKAPNPSVPEQYPQMNATFTVASATTTPVGSAPSLSVSVSGVVTITAFDNVPAGIIKLVKFVSSLVLTHNPVSFILPAAANITTAAGDESLWRSLGSGNWECVTYWGTFSPSAFVSRRNTVLIGPTDIMGMPSILPQSVTGLTALTTQNITSAETVQTNNVTTAVASPGVVGDTAHTKVVGQAISFTTSGSLPTGLTAGVTYYILAAGFTANSYEVALTPGGTAINFTGATSGQSVVWSGVQNVLSCTAFAGSDNLYGEINFNSLTSSNLTWTSLPNNSTVYLYLLIAGGVATPALTTLAPVIVYGSTTAPSITAGQITINVVLGESYLGTGSAAVETPLVMFGTATTSGGNITATQTYNYGKPPMTTGQKAGTFIKRTIYSTPGSFIWYKGAQTNAIEVTVCGGSGGGGGGGQNGANGVNGSGGIASFGTLISAQNGTVTGADISFAGPSGGTGGAPTVVGGAAVNNTLPGYTIQGGTGGTGFSGAAGGAGGFGMGGGGGGGGANLTFSGALGGPGGGLGYGYFDATAIYAVPITLIVGQGGALGGANGSGCFIIVDEHA